MDRIEVTPVRGPLLSSVRAPGSKSITNRALLLAAMADGPSQVRGALFCDDTRYMLGALRQLDFKIVEDETSGLLEVEGRGGLIPAESGDLFVGGAGTAMRFLSGFLTLASGRFRLDGNPRMRERPLGELIEALHALGVKARSELDNQCPPVIIEGEPGRFAGGAVTVHADRSSQFVSALLLPAPLWKNGLRLEVIGEAGRPFVEMTLHLMQRWGAETRVEGESIIIPGGQKYRPQRFEVESDASSASYFAAAAMLCGGSVVIENIGRGSIQGDLRFIEILRQMGATVRWSANAVEVSGGGAFHGIDLDMSGMPDMVPTLAVLAPFADSPTRIRKVGFIRHHESDRIAALAAELKRMGAKVEEFDDGLEVHPSKLNAAAIKTYDDHRIAMSFAIVGLRLAGLIIENPSCTSKTYPGFFTQLAALR